MRRIKVVAQAEYDFNDLRKDFVDQMTLDYLARNGIDLEIVNTANGPGRAKSKARIDVLVVDFHQHKALEDTVALCRCAHPCAKVVMIDTDHIDRTDRKYDYFCHTGPLDKPCPVYKLAQILRDLDFITNDQACILCEGEPAGINSGLSTG